MPTRGAPPLGGAVRGAPPGWRPATPSIYRTGSSGGSIYRDGGVNYAGPRRGRYTDAVSREQQSGGVYPMSRQEALLQFLLGGLAPRQRGKAQQGRRDREGRRLPELRLRPMNTRNFLRRLLIRYRLRLAY